MSDPVAPSDADRLARHARVVRALKENAVARGRALGDTDLSPMAVADDAEGLPLAVVVPFQRGRDEVLAAARKLAFGVGPYGLKIVIEGYTTRIPLDSPDDWSGSMQKDFEAGDTRIVQAVNVFGVDRGGRMDVVALPYEGGGPGVEGLPLRWLRDLDHIQSARADDGRASGRVFESLTYSIGMIGPEVAAQLVEAAKRVGLSAADAARHRATAMFRVLATTAHVIVVDRTLVLPNHAGDWLPSE